MVIVKHMKKIIIFIAVVVIALVAYLVISKNKDMNEGANQAAVIKSTTSSKFPGDYKVTPVIERFNGNKAEDVQKIYIDGLKRKVPSQDVPR